ncbi:efflux RND transporter permease subunit [Sphingopyxis alaskensis]|uniref:Acriflavin resistance protein n=1 Tax=Sphingopyxis alaskensis (strain DSM 13593 / LMG 18877 / RB2256) TaxID=317655 RepID=Q1GS77_SPHAL|nr:efflux RND transporter permease subunit [Sphingopyxis alaskensis]ABF53495.1 acriflavin resistance protein [Sphingopyxis alaskensis RB2256]MCM3421073.1 efflux RND transporter permease subunit [Sphingopyxis alaskensis]
MLERLVRWSLENRAIVYAIAALLTAFGAWTALRTPVDVLPDLTAPTVTVVVDAGGYTPTEVEQRVTIPLETALNGSPGLRRIRSNSATGLAVVTLEFDWATPPESARRIVAERLQTAGDELPADLPPPHMTPASSVMGEIMFVALRSNSASPMDLKSTADWIVRRRVMSVPGIAEVLTIGGDERQVQLLVDPARMSARGIGMNQVIDAMSAASDNRSAGVVVANGQELLVEGVGRAAVADDFGSVVVGDAGGVPVLAREIGDIRIGEGLKRGTGAFNGKPAVILAIQKQPGANTLELTDRLDTVFAELQRTLPDGMVLETRVFRQADFIQRSVDNVTTALIEGLVLVAVIVFIFLVSWRATAVALAAIPVSVVSAIIVINAGGGTINTMTLGGLAIALGMLVDDAIIVVENVVRRLRLERAKPTDEQQSDIAVVAAATGEVQGAIIFATLIILLVFLPIFGLSGIEGRLLQPLALAYGVSLLASLAVALTLTPALSYDLLSRRPDDVGHEPGWVIRMKAWYVALLDRWLDRWRVLAVGSMVMVVVAGIGIALAGRAFLPEFNEGSLTVNVTTLPGTSLADSDRAASEVEAALLSQPEVRTTARRTGRAPGDPHAQEVFASEIEASLNDEGRDRDELLAALRDAVGTVPGVQAIFGQPIGHRVDHILSGARANIAIKVFAPDTDTLQRVSTQVENAVAAIPGTVDVQRDTQSLVPYLRVRLRRADLASYGLAVEDVTGAIEAAIAGAEVGQLIERPVITDVVVRYDPVQYADAGQLDTMLIAAPGGQLIPLSAIADVVRDTGPNAITRESVERMQLVLANVSGRDLGAVVADIDTALDGIALPQGVHIEMAGQFESAASAGRTLLALGLIVLVGMFLLLQQAFRSGRDALLVMINLPLALVGGVVGLWLTGGVLSVATIVGFITLFGIATRNGVMMVTHIKHLQAVEGVTDLAEAVRRGSEERLVPILMTAISAGLALLPLAIALGEPGSEIQAPMAIVILCGLTSSTVLNMLVLPALYLKVTRDGWGVKWPARRRAESAA